MKLTLQQVLKAWVSIRNIEKDKASTAFAYGIVKNKNKMQGDIDGIAAAEKLIKDVENERVAYCEKNADKDKDGKPVIENGSYKGISVDTDEFKEILKKVETAGKEYSELMKKEVEIDFHMIAFESVPGQIAPADLENLLCMIKEPEVKK